MPHWRPTASPSTPTPRRSGSWRPSWARFSARTAQIHRNIDRYEAQWRSAHPVEEPGRRLRESWDRRAWAEARPDKVVPINGADLVARWNDELRALGYRDPDTPIGSHGPTGPRVGELDRDLAAEVVVARLGGKRSAWNPADVRGQVELLLAHLDLVTDARTRTELAEDLTARAIDRCTPLLTRDDVPEHVRALTSAEVLAVEQDLVNRLHRRAARPARYARLHRDLATRLDPSQARVVSALAGGSDLLVIEGAAGAGKTTTIATARNLLARHRHRLLVVTPTLKAAEVAARETGANGRSAAWLLRQHGWRWDDQGHRLRLLRIPEPSALLRPGDLLLVDEAGMLDQDTAAALLTIADEAGARVAFLGDRHQLPAVGRGGVLDLAATWAHPTGVVGIDTVHRFTDAGYAALTLKMRTGTDPAGTFDALLERGQIVVHASDVERTAALAEFAATTGDLVVADTREQVAQLNATIRDTRRDRQCAPDHRGDGGGWSVATARGEQITLGDRVATRRNDPALGVANRQTWTVTGIGDDGSLVVHRHENGTGRDHELPPGYVHADVELAYATTAYGAQGETVDRAHVVIGERTGAATAYVGMTRGRQTNTAHLVADSVDDARQKWTEAFSRDRADLGPAHARRRALEDINRYGPNAPRRRLQLEPQTYPPSRDASVGGLGI